ncbi:MAG: LD-carboxypeptidase [Bdellovibrionales bacterium]
MVNDLTSAAFPPLLPPHGKVGIVAPSCHAPRAWTDNFKKKLVERGYQVVVHEQCYLKNGTLAGSDEARAQALMDMFVDSSIKAVFCVRGGTGATQILERLDYDAIQKNPKPFVGFSDMTALVNTITMRTGLVTFHGPMGWNFLSENADVRTEEALFAMIEKGERTLTFPDLEIDREGAAQGRLIGGNISLLRTLIGTPYEWPSEESILFIEDVEEPLYKIEVAMTHLRLAGKFKGVRAVLVGEMIDILDEKPDLDPREHTVYGHSLKDIMLKHLPPDIPLAFNVPCGHGRHLMTFPVGATVSLSLKQGQSAMEVTPCS